MYTTWQQLRWWPVLIHGIHLTDLFIETLRIWLFSSPHHKDHVHVTGRVSFSSHPIRHKTLNHYGYVGLTLVHCPRRWISVKPTLIQRLVSAGFTLAVYWSCSDDCLRRANGDEIVESALSTPHRRLPTPANTRRSSNAGLMLGQCRRRWLNIKPALGERLLCVATRVVFLGILAFIIWWNITCTLTW